MKNRVHYYTDFPSYGKPKRMCPFCLNNYLQKSYERINYNIPITKYLVTKKQQKIVKWKCFIPTKKK